MMQHIIMYAVNSKIICTLYKIYEKINVFSLNLYTIVQLLLVWACKLEADTQQQLQ